MSLTDFSKKKVIGFVDINIPWSTIDREMLFWQSAPRSDYADITDDEGHGIEKLNVRMTRVMSLLDPILEKLPIGATIVDIGAGNSLIDILINIKFADKKFKFILVDSDNTYPGVLSANFYEDGYATYNNWSFLENAIKSNNMDSSSFVTKAPDDVWSDQQVDFVFSLASWCWHYPVDTYIDKVDSLVKQGGYLHVNSVLNIDKAFFKLTTCFKPIYLKTNNFSPTRSEVENSRTSKFLKQNNIDPTNFSFIFTGKK
jgi:16S rRNA G527 N7-methylase RsmG